MTNLIKEVINNAARLVAGRSGDIDTEDGSFAAVSVDDILHLESSIVSAFSLTTDDVRHEDLGIIESHLNESVMTNLTQIKSADDISALVTFAKKEADAYEKEGIAGASNLIHRLLEELQNQTAVIAQPDELIPATPEEEIQKRSAEYYEECFVNTREELQRMIARAQSIASKALAAIEEMEKGK